jgi:hypothetical protein
MVHSKTIQGTRCTHLVPVDDVCQANESTGESNVNALVPTE